MSEKLEELLVGDEVEPGELTSFLFKVGFQMLLDSVHGLVELEELVVVLDSAVDSHRSLLVHLLHELVPAAVDEVEVLVVLRTLLSDVWRCENVLQVKPVPLAFLPLLNCLGNQDQLFLEFLDLLLESLDIPRALNVTDSGERLVQDVLNRVHLGDLESVAVFVTDDIELLLNPDFVNLVDLLLKVKLLGRSRRNVKNLFLLGCNLKLDKLTQLELPVLQGEVMNVQDAFDFVPVNLSQVLVAESLHDGHRLLEIEDQLLEFFDSATVRWQVSFALDHSLGVALRDS